MFSKKCIFKHRRRTAKTSNFQTTANGPSETTPLIKNKVDSLDVKFKPPTTAKEKETSFQNGVPSPFSPPDKHIDGPGRGRGRGSSGGGLDNHLGGPGGGMVGHGRGGPSRQGFQNGGGRGGGGGGRGGPDRGSGKEKMALSAGAPQADKNTVQPSLFRVLLSTFWAQFLVSQVLMLVYTLLQFVNPNVLR